MNSEKRSTLLIECVKMFDDASRPVGFLIKQNAFASE